MPRMQRKKVENKESQPIKLKPCVVLLKRIGSVKSVEKKSSTEEKPKEKKNGRTSTASKDNADGNIEINDSPVDGSTSDSGGSHVKESEMNGFERGLEAEKILGITNAEETLTFFIKFKGLDQEEIVPATVANAKIPQMVMDFYEDRIAWYSGKEE